MAGGKVRVEGESNVGSVISQDVNKANQALNELEKHGKAAGSAAKDTGTSINSLAGEIQALGAAVAGSQILQFVGELVQAGAASDRMSTSLNALTSGHADDYIQAVGEASLQTVSNMDAMTYSARALQLGVVDSTAEMAELTQAALVLGRAMGIDASEAMDKLIIGIGRLSPLRLDDLGLQVKMADVTEEANALMEQNAALTFEAAQKQAIYNLAMAQANELLEAQNGLQVDSASLLERAAADWSDIKTAVGEDLNERLMPWFAGAQMVNDAFAEQSERVLQTAQSYEEWRAGMEEAVDNLGVLGRLLTGADDNLDLSREAYEKLTAEMERNTDAIAGWGVAGQAAADRWEAYTAQNRVHATTLEELTAAYNEAASAVTNYLQIMEQQSAMQLEILQQVPEFMSSQQGLVDVFGLGVSALGNYNLSASETLQLYQELGLATGEVTAAQIAQSQAIQQLTNLWVDGQISATQYADSLGAIQAGADAATVSQDVMTAAASEAAQVYLDQAAAIVEAEGSAAQAAAAMQAAQQAYADTMSAMENAASGGANQALEDAEAAVNDLFSALENAPESVTTAFNLEAGDALAQLNEMIGLMNDAQAPVQVTVQADVEAAAAQVGEFVAQLDTAGAKEVKPVFDASSAKGAQHDVAGLQGAADAVEGTYNIHFNITQSGEIPVIPGSAGAPGKALGGPVSAGNPYLVGEQGPELIIPSANGFVLTAAETSALMASEQGGAAAGGGGIQIGSLSIALPNVINAADFLPELERELRTLGKGFAPLGVAA